MKKHIYASGCSFTEKDYIIYETQERPGWPMWPEIVGKKFNLPVINEGNGGSGNDYIERKALRHIVENHENIELVTIAWTQMTRFSIFEHFNVNTSWLLDHDPFTWNSEDIVGNMAQFNQTATNFLLDYDRINKMYTAFFQQVLSIQKACEKFGIKYVFACAINPLPSSIINHVKWNQNHHFNLWINNPYLEHINKKNFIGWPCMPQMRGFSLDTFLTPIEHTVSKNDYHPNHVGQQILAKKFTEHYEKIYRHP